jgi:uncharacterized LabA/DUF88 family protein
MEVRRTAVMLIDLENQTDLSVESLRRQLGQRFYLIDQLAFADYSRPSLRSVAGRLKGDGLTPIHVNTFNGTGYVPNGVDQVMARIIDRFARRDHIAAIVVVSGDEYFVRCVKRARRLGKQVIVASDPDRAGRRLQNAANEFMPLHSQRARH